MKRNDIPVWVLILMVFTVAIPGGVDAAIRPVRAAADTRAAGLLEKRWLFIWQDMKDPKQVERMIERFPRAKAAGYNGVAFPCDLVESKAAELRQAAKRDGLDLIAIVMGGSHDRNYVEGLSVKDSLFVVHGGKATLVADNPTRVLNADFEESAGNHCKNWSFQDDEGVTSFVDHEVKHGGAASLRMENIGKNPARHCRIMQQIKLQPQRQYRISFWLKSQGLAPADAEVKVLKTDGVGSLSFQAVHVDPTQDWKHYDITFNSLDSSTANLYLGSWNGKDGKMWWDDLTVDEIGLVNVLRRPGCPVAVRSESGSAYEEGRDFARIVDPLLNPWQAYHEQPAIKLAPATRIKDGDRLRVSYYHPIIVYEDRITSCLSEPQIFTEWEADVKRINELIHPAAFLMSHDELRVVNQCALCQSKKMTPGELLAGNVRQAAQIIRGIRPDAGIWVWSDMFDPLHNAVDHFYAVNGPLTGSWKGLDKDVGIVNWYGSLQGKNCRFFADLGLKQILSGYYDGDEEGSAITSWRNNTKDVPRIVGAMYTTWQDKYEAMDVWAKRAWGASP
ncbi:MAG: carbohydrate binding domain-containing protein [Verrucomicrobiota bacterium]